jgi:hypothetical protein
MRDAESGITYTIEETDGTWFQLWYDGEECVYSEDLQAKSRDEAEKEAAGIAATGSPLERIMEALGAAPEAPK